MQTMQQQRARYALQQVETARQQGVDSREYKSYASGLSAMIQMNGLGQMAAFYYSQGGTHRQLYDLLSGWLTQPGQPYAGLNDLLQGITRRNMRTYLLAQAEALALLDWVKKFAKAYMED